MCVGEKINEGGGEHEIVCLLSSDGVRNVNGRFGEGHVAGSLLRERESRSGVSESSVSDSES